MKIIKTTIDGNYLQILGENEAPCINEQYEFDGIKYRVLKCHSFVNDASKFKATLIKIQKSKS